MSSVWYERGERKTSETSQQDRSHFYRISHNNPTRSQFCCGLLKSIRISSGRRRLTSHTKPNLPPANPYPSQFLIQKARLFHKSESRRRRYFYQAILPFAERCKSFCTACPWLRRSLSGRTVTVTLSLFQKEPSPRKDHYISPGRASRLSLAYSDPTGSRSSSTSASGDNPASCRTRFSISLIISGCSARNALEFSRP